MKYIIIFLLLFCFLLDLFFIKIKDKKLRCFTKPLLMPILLLYYIISANNIEILIILALICGFLGDTFLLKENNNKFFILGTLSFLIGHVFYIIKYIQLIGDINNVLIWTIIFATAYLIYGVYIYKRLCNNLGNFKLQIKIYLAIILIMSFTCFMAYISYKGILIYSFLGSLLFIFSDTLLSFNIFVSKNEYNDYIIMLSYVLAQFLIVTSFISL